MFSGARDFLLMSDDFVLRFSSMFFSFLLSVLGSHGHGDGGVEFGAATQDLTSDMFEGYRVGAGTMPIKIQQVTQHQSRSSWCHFLAYRGEMGQHMNQDPTSGISSGKGEVGRMPIKIQQHTSPGVYGQAGDNTNQDAANDIS